MLQLIFSVELEFHQAHSYCRSLSATDVKAYLTTMLELIFSVQLEFHQSNHTAEAYLQQIKKHILSGKSILSSWK